MHLLVWPASRLLHRVPHSLRLILLCGCGALGTCRRSDAETVAELARDGLEVSHAAGTGGLPSLGLLAPVDCCGSILVLKSYRGAVGERTLAGLSSRVAARGAGVLLDVEGATTWSCPLVPESIRQCPSISNVCHYNARSRRRRSRTATPAERVRLVVALSEAGSSLRCIAVSLEVRACCAGGSAAYSLWARNCAQSND
jgi:hypothetical protein